MQNKNKFYVGLFLIIFGVFSVIFGAFLQKQLFSKESDAPYIFGVVFIIMGIKTLVDYKKEKPNEK